MNKRIVTTALHRPTPGGSHEWRSCGMRSTQAALLMSFLPRLGTSDRYLHFGKSTQCHKMSNVGAGRSETTLIQTTLKDIVCITGITVWLWSVITRCMEMYKIYVLLLKENNSGTCLDTSITQNHTQNSSLL